MILHFCLPDSIFWVPQYSTAMYKIFLHDECIYQPNPNYLDSGDYREGGFDATTRSILVDAMVSTWKRRRS